VNVVTCPGCEQEVISWSWHDGSILVGAGPSLDRVRRLEPKKPACAESVVFTFVTEGHTFDARVSGNCALTDRAVITARSCKVWPS
jgi:hypothetical protein